MTYTKEYAEKELNKALNILHGLEDQTDYEIPEISQCINILQTVDIELWKLVGLI